MDSRLRKPEHIYECYVEISRPKEGEESQVIFQFPKSYEIEEDTRKQLLKFAFPTSVVNDNEDHFTFVLTDLNSKYRFGFCHYRPKGDCCMCFIGDIPWYKVFYRALDKISELKLDMQNELVEPLLSGLYSHPLPSSGEDKLVVVPEGRDHEGQVYCFPLPSDKRLPEIPTDHNLTYFYTNIHHNVLLHLFANMIFERRIIITSSSLSLLSATVHGCVMLLYPLHWQHIFIPITPRHLKDYCAAPMPFLMGIHSSLMNEVRQMPMDEVVILDMDENVIESPHVEDLMMMPYDVISQLKHVVKKESSGYGDNAAKAFLIAMVSMIGGYRKALKFREGEKEVVFDEDTFIQSRSQMEEFLSTLLHFQHFRQFINCKIEQLKNQTYERDLFDKEVLFYEEEMKGTTQEQIKAAFDKFMLSTKGSGKKLEKWGNQFQKGVTKRYAKVVDKRAFQKLMKETKKHLHGIGKESKFGELPSIENAAAITTFEKSQSLPSVQRSGSIASTSSQHTPSMLRKGPTRPVIPYHVHQEGKRRLAESLVKQQRVSSGKDVPASVLRMLTTPPDTPQSSHSPDDHMEKASLDSRSSTEASTSVSSGDVPTGNLVDVSVTDDTAVKYRWMVGEGVMPPPPPATPSVTLEVDRGDFSELEANKNLSDSESFISTASSSSDEAAEQGVRLRNWVQFDNNTTRPPLPLPCSTLEDTTKQDVSLEALPIPVPTIHTNNHWNPFSSPPVNSGRVSPYEGFSASIADTLFSQSKTRNSLDEYSANIMASASRELYKTIDTHNKAKSAVLPEPLIPTTSASVSSTGAVLKPAIHDPSNSSQYNPFAEPPESTMTTTTSPNIQLLHTINMNGGSNSLQKCPSVPLSHSSSTPQRDKAQARRPPPPKPRPYSGKPVSAFQQQLPLPSPGDDPFGNLLSGMSMQAYANSMKNITTSLPSVECSTQDLNSNSPQKSLSSSHPSPQNSPIESPLV